MSSPQLSSAFRRSLRRVSPRQCMALRGTRSCQTSRLYSSLPPGPGAQGSQPYLASTKANAWNPYLHFSIGLAFVGSLVYSVVSDNKVKLDSPSIAQLDEATKSAAPISDASPMRLKMEDMIKRKQKEIVAELTKVDGKEFVFDEWKRKHGGGGISCVLQDGNVFEKAGVNVSVVYGKLPRAAIEKMRADHKSFVASDVDELDFFASGISMVLHPHNPKAPTVHLNYRYFETSDPKDPLHGNKNWWFGGGCDLTPSYLYPEDCKHFHQTIKDACDKHDITYYPKFKEWCDKYFYIPHRKECRGVGGIFFDDLDREFLRSAGLSSLNPQQDLYDFVSDCLAAFLPSYIPIIERRKDEHFTEAQKEWQQLRRGRYVEFNLVYDRGTQFGLRTPSARVESILMSLPRTAMWKYMDAISGTKMEEEGESPRNNEEDPEVQKQKELLDILKTPRNWV